MLRMLFYFFSCAFYRITFYGRKLFDEDVAQTPAEAEAFLEDCMAIVVDSIEEVRDYLK